MEEYLSRMLPALRRQSVCLQRSFLDNQDYYILWISFPSTKLAASCFPPSPEPRHKRTLSPLNDLTRAHSTAPVKPSGSLRFASLDPESLYPWRPDCTYLLAIHLFTLHTH
ncbi:hypothetical protein CHARACLAT_022306 [Characodon lateralis]|uniref:Uncharacterized protein n=1 Tax=Characodon lateralis TaxID=208331 RepID=A0ABU7EVT9_9TELE|nr:hypothetical protein [Characodon lateralis]